MARLIPLWGKHGLGKFVIVDDEDYERLRKLKWVAQTSKRGIIYPVTYFEKSRGNGVNIPMNRMVLNALPDAQIDYKNRNGLDNQKKNLHVRHA